MEPKSVRKKHRTLDRMVNLMFACIGLSLFGFASYYFCSETNSVLKYTTKYVGGLFLSLHIFLLIAIFCYAYDDDWDGKERARRVWTAAFGSTTDPASDVEHDKNQSIVNSFFAMMTQGKGSFCNSEIRAGHYYDTLKTAANCAMDWGYVVPPDVLKLVE